MLHPHCVVPNMIKYVSDYPPIHHGFWEELRKNYTAFVWILYQYPHYNPIIPMIIALDSHDNPSIIPI